MTFDSLGELITIIIGPTGRYQIFLFLVISLCRMPDIWHQIILILVAPPVGEFTCSDPALSPCDKACPSHEFDHSVWEKTIVHEWDLVCDWQYMPSTIQSIVLSGVLAGNIIFGYLGDRFGRRGPLIFGVMLHFAAGVAAAFAPWLWLYIVLRWLCNFAVGSTVISSFTILMEFTSHTYRPVFGILFTLPCIIGHMLLGPIGYFVRRWDHIQLIISAPSVVLLSYWCLMPESPRWLITVGRIEPSIQLLTKAAKCNRLPTEDIRKNIEEFVQETPAQDQKKGGNIFDLFRTKRMRQKTLILIINWMCVALSFFATVEYVGQIGGNIFLNIGLSGAIQIPGNLAACLLIRILGRKWCLITAYYACSISMLTICIIRSFPHYPDWPIQVMSCISLMCIAAAFSILFVYSGELYPTILRAVGMGLSSMFSRIGSMIAPFINETRTVGLWVPPLALSAFPAVAATLAMFCLPDTTNTPLSNTVEDANTL